MEKVDTVGKKKRNQDPALIRWCFRCNAAINDEPNEVTDREQHALFLLNKLKEHCDVIAFQLESAPTTGYLHYQGYFELTNRKRKGWILSHIQAFEYVAQAKGTPKQAWKYCTKEDTRIAGPWTYGEPRASENENKTGDFVKACFAGHDDKHLFNEFPSFMTRHRHTPDHIRSLEPPERTSPLEVYLFYGEPGTGKTDFAYEQARLLGVHPYEIPLGKDFWLTPDAHGKKYILIDEFKSNLQLKDLLKLLDKRPLKAPVKGSFVWWCPDIVVITTNKNPWEWYGYQDRDFEREALFRRITAAYLFRKNADGVPRPEEVTLDSLKPKIQYTFSPAYLKAIDRLDFNGYLPVPQMIPVVQEKGQNERFKGGFKRTFVTPSPPAKRQKIDSDSSVDFEDQQAALNYWKVHNPMKTAIVVPDTPPDALLERDKGDTVMWDDFGPTQPVDELGNPETVPKRWF